jgi:signal transduction histidine kinase
MHKVGSLRNTRLGVGPILDSLPLGVAVYDNDMNVVAANAKALAILDPDQSPDAAAMFNVTTPSSIHWPDHLSSVLATGQPQHLDQVQLVTGHGSRFFQVLLTPIRGADGQETRAVAAVFSDVTDTLHLTRELEIAERSAALGKLTATVAHELTGPLDGALRYVSLALRQLDQGDIGKTQQYLQRSKEGLQRMIQIASQILEYSRGMPIPMTACPLDQLVRDAIMTAEARRTGPAIDIQQSYGPDVPVLRRGNVFQVFCNIIRNAHEAMPNGGRIEIQASATEGDMLVMTFHDTGSGFPPHAMEKAFEPFFTTKERGTGLGLAVCRDIVHQYNGQIYAENAAEGGARITLRLPLAEII